ncbi:MAG TPA: vitamin K epoxide reductase family protein [Polyangiaceae bacterium]|nr:vitamin K epoxide reductase family protein [Polyangiaceae bacterium]
MNRVRLFAWIGVAGALWGLIFAGISSLDYASHLDRGLHDLHCSFIPGAEASPVAEGCRTALNSPYAALFKQELWGGVPISLFGLGCFAFLLGHALSIAYSGSRTTRGAGALYAAFAISPLIVSAIMFSISWFVLGSICKTCAGIYTGSVVLAISALGVLAGSWGNRARGSGPGLVLAAALAFGMLLFVLAPSVVYAALAPDHSKLVTQCGTVKIPKESHGALLALHGTAPKKHALFFEDPLCPTCKSLHERLRAAGVLDRLDVDLALFPLDNQCNWMLEQPLHPGACAVARATLCAKSTGDFLDWAYANQEELAAAAKAGGGSLSQLLSRKWGSELTSCMNARATEQRLNRHLHFAVDNAIAVSTPQVFIENQRLCDEDIDMGLMFALGKLAPELVQ